MVSKHRSYLGALGDFGPLQDQRPKLKSPWQDFIAEMALLARSLLVICSRAESLVEGTARTFFPFPSLALKKLCAKFKASLGYRWHPILNNKQIQSPPPLVASGREAGKHAAVRASSEASRVLSLPFLMCLCKLKVALRGINPMSQPVGFWKGGLLCLSYLVGQLTASFCTSDLSVNTCEELWENAT